MVTSWVQQRMEHSQYSLFARQPLRLLARAGLMLRAPCHYVVSGEKAPLAFAPWHKFQSPVYNMLEHDTTRLSGRSLHYPDELGRHSTDGFHCESHTCHIRVETSRFF